MAEAKGDSRKRTRKRARNWRAYNAAQVNEKEQFRILLHEACRCVEQPEQVGGRPRLPLADMIFCNVYKVYSTICHRRHMTDIREAHAAGFITRAPHFNSVQNYLRHEWLTPALTRLIEITSLPLLPVEVDFAVDATGLSTDRYARWLDERELRERSRRQWVKLHLICGVRTNVVTCALVDPGHESRFFGRLVAATARNFKMEEVSADKAYHSGENMRHALLAGAVPFISFKENSRPDADYKSTIWKRMLDMFLNERWRFMAHYNKRNNVETTFSMIKAKFGHALSSRDQQARVNEALVKVICHNLCVLIRAVYELGIEPKFEQVVNTAALAQESPERLAPVAGGRIAAGQKVSTGLEGKEAFKKRGGRGRADSNQLTLSFTGHEEQSAAGGQTTLF